MKFPRTICQNHGSHTSRVFALCATKKLSFYPMFFRGFSGRYRFSRKFAGKIKEKFPRNAKVWRVWEKWTQKFPTFFGENHGFSQTKRFSPKRYGKVQGPRSRTDLGNFSIFWLREHSNVGWSQLWPSWWSPYLLLQLDGEQSPFSLVCLYFKLWARPIADALLQKWCIAPKSDALHRQKTEKSWADTENAVEKFRCGGFTSLDIHINYTETTCYTININYTRNN